MIAAVIDIGTNSIKSIVGKLDGGGHICILAEEQIISRLGEGVQESGELKPEAQTRTIAAICKLVGSAQELGAQRIRIVATSAVRDARNKYEFAERVKSELGLDLEVLSGKDECWLSYSAVAMDPELGEDGSERGVVDSGGGSTEFIFGRGGRITYSKSAQLGAVRLTEQALKNDPPSSDEIAEAKRIAEQIIREALNGRSTGLMIGVGGSAVNLARIAKHIPTNNTSEVHASVLTIDQIRELVNTLGKLTFEQKRSIVGLDPERADIILAGAIIMEHVLSVLNIDRLVVSIHGLRHGVLYELLGVKS